MFQFNRLVGVAVLFAIAFTATPTTALAQTSAPVEWKVSDGGNGHWYQVQPKVADWFSCRVAAISQGADLACLSSATESEYVATIIPYPTTTWNRGFMGGFQDPNSEPTSGWHWVDGSPWGFTNWDSEHQPDGGEGFLSIYRNNGVVVWGDYSSSDSDIYWMLLEWSADCNNDGIVDYGQILRGELNDDNNNGVPDICESQTWATVLEFVPNPAVVTDANLRAAIAATNLPWRVLDNGTNIEMLLVTGGTFTMGCSASSNYSCDSNENLTHQVTLSKAFYLGKTEVTQAQWTAKMLSNPSYFSSNPNNPVEQVSWNDIAGFNTATGLRLPSEAEWEYACRGNTTTAFHSMPGYPNGTNVDSLLGNIAWNGNNSGSITHAVAGKAANAFGMYDMSGNVWEWCNDWYGGTYYSASPSTDPVGPSSGSARVLRGGSWYNDSDYCRSSTRSYFAPDNRNIGIGFRVARTP